MTCVSRPRQDVTYFSRMPTWCLARAVYNQDNREKVARDEANFEEEEKERRAKHRKAESEYRHAALLARVRGELLVRF